MNTALFNIKQKNNVHPAVRDAGFTRPNFARQNSGGFTIIEVIISIAVLMLGVVAAYGSSFASVRLADSIRNNVTAASLAQEGIETVHAIRDSNWFQGNFFDDGLGDGDYEVEWSSTVLTLYADQFLRLNSDGLYQYLSGPNTIFKRRITIINSNPGLGPEITVESQVTWTEYGRNKSVTLESHLFNWLE